MTMTDVIMDYKIVEVRGVKYMETDQITVEHIQKMNAKQRKAYYKMIWTLFDHAELKSLLSGLKDGLAVATWYVPEVNTNLYFTYKHI